MCSNSKKLYTVTVEVQYVVVAKDKKDAERVAYKTAKSAVGDQAFDDLYFLISEGIHADGWDERATPYGGEAGWTIGDYLEQA